MAIKRTIKRSNEPDVLSLFNAFEEFITEKEAKNLSLPTIKNYSQTFRIFCNFHGFDEDTPITAITPTHFYKWINTLKLEGVKPSSINHYLRDCRAFFYWCMDANRKYIEKAFKIEMVKGQEESLKTFSDEELDRLLEKPRRSEDFVTWRTWVISNWVIGTGNRAATICEIKIGDVDFKAKEISLRHTKNKKAQIIPLSSSLATILKEYLKLWRWDCRDEDWLFPNIGDEKMSTNALHHSFARYCKKREVAHSNIHGLRHTFAKMWVKNNGSEIKLQKILGHSSLEMTRRYVRLFAEDIKEDFDDFSPLDTLKKSQKRTQAIKREDD